MFKILQANEEYENKVRQYTAKDGIFALLLFGMMILCYAVLALLEIRIDAIRENIILTGCIFNVFIIGIAILFIRLNKQTLDTIGLYKGKWKSSVITGGVPAGILFFFNCLSHLMEGEHLIPAWDIAGLSVYYLLVSVCEEVVFRGYIGTRIYGLIKYRWLAVFAAGILFVVMHFPYRMIAYGMTISDLTIGNLSWMIDLFVTHMIFNFIYLKTNSLYGAIIPHWMSNFAYSIVAK